MTGFEVWAVGVALVGLFLLVQDLSTHWAYKDYKRRHRTGIPSTMVEKLKASKRRQL